VTPVEEMSNFDDEFIQQFLAGECIGPVGID
jgi:hypothetical protein